MFDVELGARAHAGPAGSRLGQDRRAGGLDPDRLALFMLAQRLFLVAGPMRLLGGDFPDRAFMRGIIEHNLSEALALLT